MSTREERHNKRQKIDHITLEEDRLRTQVAKLTEKSKEAFKELNYLEDDRKQLKQDVKKVNVVDRHPFPEVIKHKKKDVKLVIKRSDDPAQTSTGIEGLEKLKTVIKKKTEKPKEMSSISIGVHEPGTKKQRAYKHRVQLLVNNKDKTLQIGEVNRSNLMTPNSKARVAEALNEAAPTYVIPKEKFYGINTWAGHCQTLGKACSTAEKQKDVITLDKFETWKKQGSAAKRRWEEFEQIEKSDVATPKTKATAKKGMSREDANYLGVLKTRVAQVAEKNLKAEEKAKIKAAEEKKKQSSLIFIKNLKDQRALTKKKYTVTRPKTFVKVAKKINQ